MIVSKVLQLTRHAVHLGPRATLNKACWLGVRTSKHCLDRMRDALVTSYPPINGTPHRLLRYLAPFTAIDAKAFTQAAAVAPLYVDHCFDLLGSGWRQVRHGMDCAGVEGHRYHAGQSVGADRDGHWLKGRIDGRNLPQAQRIWQMIEGEYQPIDWHVDFKSGYRWSENTWHGSIPYGHLPGVDIKVPWELSRMQHLPQMALAYAAVRETNPAQAAEFARSYRNQILDFIACNPPRFGVNWRCPMDVAIRAANWLLAHDLFCAAGVPEHPAFEAELAASIVAHGRHIVENLEWRPKNRGNHYLADICGLLFIAAYLPCSPEVDAWLAFSVRQLIAEVNRQFTPDGANFEASTSYHRLSTEMVTFATAWTLALGDEKRSSLANYDHRRMHRQPGLEPAPLPMYRLPSASGRSPFPPEHFERLARMAEFSRDVTKPNGVLHQVGDNDSGRFFKLEPSLIRRTVHEAKSLFQNLQNLNTLDDNAVYWDEDHLEHRGTISAIVELVGRDDLGSFAGADWGDALVVRNVLSRCGTEIGHVTSAANVARNLRLTTNGETVTVLSKLENDAALTHSNFKIQLPSGALSQPLMPLAYPDFGLYIWRNDRIYLAVRCGPVGQEGNGGHAHNDQLAIELQVDGEDWLADPGTYLYTSDPQRRNEYRSVAAHFSPRLNTNAEPGNLKIGLFQLSDTAQAKCLAFDAQNFVGSHLGYGTPIYRAVTISCSDSGTSSPSIVVRDYCDRSLKLAPIDDLDLHRCRHVIVPFSQGYGIARAA